MFIGMPLSIRFIENELIPILGVGIRAPITPLSPNILLQNFIDMIEMASEFGGIILENESGKIPEEFLEKDQMIAFFQIIFKKREDIEKFINHFME